MENDDGQAGGKFFGVLGTVDCGALALLVCWMAGSGFCGPEKKSQRRRWSTHTVQWLPLAQRRLWVLFLSRVPGMPSGECRSVSRATRATVDRRTTQRAEELRCLSNDRPLGPELALTTGPGGDGDPRRSSASSLGVARLRSVINKWRTYGGLGIAGSAEGRWGGLEVR